MLPSRHLTMDWETKFKLVKVAGQARPTTPGPTRHGPKTYLVTGLHLTNSDTPGYGRVPAANILSMSSMGVVSTVCTKRANPSGYVPECFVSTPLTAMEE